MALDIKVTETARFGGIDFATLAERIRATAQERGLPVSESGAGLRLTTPIGTLDFTPEGDRVRLDISAPDASAFQTIRDGAVETLVGGLPQIAETLSWETAPRAGMLPPNFRFVTLQSVRPLTRDFLRVQVAGEGLDPFAGDRMHFRIVLPQPDDPDPVWPSLDAAGRTIWPEGAQALHRPVYTTVRCDPGAGLLEFDVFIHDGGRVTEWARTVAEGTRLGIIGPGGARVVAADRMLLAGDETAYPAISRILAGLPRGAGGHLVLMSEDAASDYPMAIPPAFTMTRLSRSGGDSMANVLRDLGPPADGGYVWVAAERSDAMATREYFRDVLGWPKDHSYFSAFWTRA